MVHPYQLNGYHIVIDSNSGNIHVVDEVAFEVISRCNDFVEERRKAKKKGVLPDQSIDLVTEEEEQQISELVQNLYGITKDEAAEIFSDLRELHKEQQLFSEDIFQPMAGEFKKRQSVLKAICLHVAHDCNMVCEYCFAGQGQYHGDRGLMSYET